MTKHNLLIPEVETHETLRPSTRAAGGGSIGARVVGAEGRWWPPLPPGVNKSIHWSLKVRRQKGLSC